MCDLSISSGLTHDTFGAVLFPAPNRFCLLCRKTLFSKPYYGAIINFLCGCNPNFLYCCIGCWDLDDAHFEKTFENALISMEQEDLTWASKRAEEELELTLSIKAPAGEMGVRKLFALQTDAALVKPARHK